MMATIYGTYGDCIWVKGIRYEITEDNDRPVLIRAPIYCDVCSENECDDYLHQTDEIAIAMCPACLSNALEYRAVMRALDMYGERDAYLHRALTYLDKMDISMRQLPLPYVSSEESAWDHIQGCSHQEQQEIVDHWMIRILGFIRGDI